MMKKVTHISIRTWRDRTYGNPYWTAKLYYNDNSEHILTQDYGNDQHALHQAFEFAVNEGTIQDGRWHHGEVMREQGITHEIVEVKKRDLWK